MPHSWFLQANATKVQKRMVNKPQHPRELAADTVELALTTAGEKYLETQ